MVPRNNLINKLVPTASHLGHKSMYKLYLIWAVVTISLTFLKDGLSNDNITHLIILLILALSLFIFKHLHPKNPKRFFIISGVILAGLVEGAYMITKPVLPSLLVNIRNFNFETFINNYAIDLLLTIPIYFLIFWVIWKLINKYNYTKWEYIFLFALGQAIGDGSGFFLLNPLGLLFIPYVMLNYHAMNIAPYLAVKNYISEFPKSSSRWKYIVTIIVLFATYLIGGTLIKIMAGILKI